MGVAHAELQEKGQSDRTSSGWMASCSFCGSAFSDLSEHFVLVLLEGGEKPSGFRRLAKRLEELD